MVSVIIPVHNSMPHLKACIEALYSSTNYPFRLILIESESTDGTKEYCDSVALLYKNVEVYHTKKEGLTKALNFGIKMAGDDVYITQDDVIHFRLYGVDWLYELYTASQLEGIDFVTGLAGGGISGKEYLEGFKWIGTWNLFLPRKTINKLGLFDENLGPGDDIDYCYRAFKAGLKFSVFPFWVQHHRLTEHGSVDNPEIIKQKAEYFRKKHNI
jgi:GT2 family glycosyltransferase